MKLGSQREPEPWRYLDGDLELKGQIWRPNKAENRKAILMLHEADGIGGNVRRHAELLRELGYNVFAADLHGAGRVLPADEIASALDAFLTNRIKLRRRAGAAIVLMLEHYGWRECEIAAVGYCFGGTAALELARAGYPISAVASFHGQLSAVGLNSGIRARLLVCTGALDPLVPQSDIVALQEEMAAAEADWTLAVFGQAKHSFTNRDVSGLGDERMAFDPNAEAASWALFLSFLEQSFERSIKRST